MKRQPHVTPRYLPPAESPRESLASLLLGVASVVGFAVALFFVLWMLQ